MCQMRGLKEYKERNPKDTLDFVTCEYLHFLAATHTDLFGRVMFRSFEELKTIAARHEGYDKVIEFTIDWENALQGGIQAAWCEETLGFRPSTDQPYFLVRNEERLVASEHFKRLKKLNYQNIALVQLDTPSGHERSFKESDYQKVFSLFPDDTLLLYTGPIDLAAHTILRKQGNLLLLPGYDMGTTAAMLELVDYVFGAHGGTIMLAHAVEAKNVTQVTFLQAGSEKLLHVPYWDNLTYPDHDHIDWDELKRAIQRRLGKGDSETANNE